MRLVNGLFRDHKLFLLLLLSAVLFTACAQQPPPETGTAPGFFLGLFQGFTMLFSFIGSIFMNVRIYAFPNSGFFYDLGYVLGAGGFFGGLGRFR